MRSAGLTGLALAVGLGLAGFGTGGALAANSQPQVALSGSAGGTTCAHFMRMSKSHRNSLVRHLVRSAPAGTLATIPPATSGGGGAMNGSTQGTKTATTESMAPLKASDLVAACQAATGTSTLRAAYQKFAMGGSASSSQ